MPICQTQKLEFKQGMGDFQSLISIANIDRTVLLVLTTV
ncbi:hypothetical protein CKA32_000451 [Geitlerinema sp. FC II]|nr:hypothetical protein CKA32_000451 [Geitlerinema sp. FC II]